MKVERIRLHRLRQELKEPITWCCGRDVAALETTVVEVRTDDGLTGWGDGHDARALLTRHPEWVIGHSPFEAEAIFLRLGGQARGAMTPGGLDVALWDLMGKITGKPVTELLGPVWRWRIKPYASVGYRKGHWKDLPGAFAEDLSYCTKDRGFRAVKMKTGYGVETDVSIVSAARAAIGPEVALCIDSGSPGVYDAGTAARLGGRLEPFDLFWWEEPVHAGDLEGFRRLKNVLRMPLAGGEAVGLDVLLKDYIAAQLIDIVQPDIERMGFSGARLIDHAAWLNRVRVVPHTWAHTPLRIAATMHWIACMPNEHALHVSPPEPLLELHPPHEAVAWDLTEERLELDPTDGRIPLPEGPGLGLTVIPEMLEKYRVGEVVEIA